MRKKTGIMVDIPKFDEAAEKFSRFLIEQGHSGNLEWVFREDLCGRTKTSLWARMPTAVENEQLARKVYRFGRVEGLISISAIASFRKVILASVWYPDQSSQRVQGWDSGLKLSINTPLPVAKGIPGFIWNLVRFTPSYQRFQNHEQYIGTRI
jgi:hypothetical protein